MKTALIYKPDKIKPTNKLEAGLTKATVLTISNLKNEQKWMRDFRLSSYETFKKIALPAWGPELGKLDFSKLHYFVRQGTVATKWSQVPAEIKRTFDRLGIPKAEQQFLAGVGAQYESEAIYHSLQADLAEKGVIFCDMDTAVNKYPELVKKYWSKAVPATDNKFAALNSAVWSGGSFVYVPKNIKLEMPLQAYFRMNNRDFGQFERTLIIADSGSSVHYIEGCTAPRYSTASLHAAVVEIFVEKGAHVRYSTVQNWSENVYNLVTKRAIVKQDGVMEWIDGNFGSAVTMKYPACYLVGENAHGELISLSYAGKNQNQDTGGRMVHLAKNTSSLIVSKSISSQNGISTFRGLVRVAPNASGSKSHMRCDSLLIDDQSQAKSLPQIEARTKDLQATHEATVAKLNEDQLFYLESRGIRRSQAERILVGGFIEPIIKQLPLEYAVELNRLIEIEMGGKS